MRAIVQVPLRHLEAASWAHSVVPGARYDLSRGFSSQRRDDHDEYPALDWDEAESSLVHAVADRYDVEPGQVALCPGAGQAIVQALIAMLRPGDHVVVERPSYEPLFRVPEMLGASVSRIDRRIEDGWQLVPERLAKVLTSRTRAVVLTNLHSPSGVACSARTLAEIASLAARVGATLLVDEVLLDFAFDPASTAPCRPAAPSPITLSPSAPPARASACPSSVSAGSSPATRTSPAASASPPTTSTLASPPRPPGSPPTRCATPTTSFLAPIASPALAAASSSAGPRASRASSGSRPTPACTPSCACRVGVNDLAFAAHLRARYETQVLPGSVLEASQCVRLGFAAPTQVLEQGLANFSAALDDMQGGATADRPPQDVA